jgi:hypothetical protein
MTLQCTSLPENITAGLTFEATLTIDAYPAPTWGFTAIIRGPKSITLIAANSGTGHKFTASAATTAAWPTGKYWCSVRATDGTSVVEVSNTEITILPDLVSAGDGYDGRTPSEIAFDSIKAVLEKRATQDQQRYSINNRELWRTPIADLLKLRAFYATQVRREKAAKSGQTTFGRQIHVRFS